MNSIYPRMPCAKFGWNWPSSLKRGFLNIFNIILLFRFYLPFEKGLALYLNKLESPPFEDVLCQVWLKLTKLFWITRFLNIFNIIYYYLPLEKDVVLHLNKLEFPSAKDVLCQVWMKLAKWFWRRRFFKNIFNIILYFCYYIPLEKGVAFYSNKH